MASIYNQIEEGDWALDKTDEMFPLSLREKCIVWAITLLAQSVLAGIAALLLSLQS